MKNKAKSIHFMKNSKFSEKKLMNRQKAHTPGKCLLKHENIHRGWTISRETKVWTRKRKDQHKGFHMVSRVKNPRIKRYRNFFPTWFFLVGWKSGWWGENLAEQKQPTNENITHFETGVFVCLSFKLNYMTFFLWVPPTSATLIFVVPKSILIFFFLFGSLETTLLGL